MKRLWKPLPQRDPAAPDRAARHAAQTAGPGPLSPEEARARGKRNLAIALGLLGFAVLIFLVTIFQLKGQVADPTL